MWQVPAEPAELQSIYGRFKGLSITSFILIEK